MKQCSCRNTLHIVARGTLAVKLLVTGTIARMATVLTLKTILPFQLGQIGIATSLIG